MRYIVGIDLGTTNSVVAYADTASPQSGVRVFGIPQLTAPGTVEARSQLPSFLYFPPEAEMGGSLALPWRPEGEAPVAGAWARRRAAETPRRVVSSAKSWLCHLGADRTGPILPLDAPEDIERISPVAASAAFLRHIRNAWDHAFPTAPLREQEVLLAVPASFDAAARELTARAAADAGLENVTLLEEPQAAFYAWIEAHGEGWREQVRVGDRIVVIDVGGGTTDFSLISVAEDAGELVLERVAVGEHILLGGDNMDLTLAYRVAEQTRAAGAGLDPWQFRALTASCREAKERLLSAEPPEAVPVSLPGRGRSVVGGTVRTEVRRQDAEEVLLDGFFPTCAADAEPLRAPRTALQEVGLPYAADPAITRHLAHFLSRHRDAGGRQRPTAVLFNGGVMRAVRLRQRLLEVLAAWPGEGEVRSLAAADPDRAVARGAAYYGLARRGRGIRIRGGAPRSYYVGVEAAMPAVPGVRPPIRALCVVPFGMEEGTEVDLPDRELRLVVGEPAEFRFLGSTVRQEDSPGAIVDTWGEDEIEELSPVEVTLESDDPAGAVVPVRLRARLTEVGVLELWCVRADDERQKWKLEFQVRASG